jgi:hypothetical protein
MDDKDCIEQYKAVMYKVFPEGNWKKTRLVAGAALPIRREFYDEAPLEQAVKDLV